MKAGINSDGIMFFKIENDDELQLIRAWVICNSGKTFMPNNRKDYAMCKLKNIEVIIIPDYKEK